MRAKSLVYTQPLLNNYSNTLFAKVPMELMHIVNKCAPITQALRHAAYARQEDVTAHT